uniref:Uncharacterized protein n=1 Tax=Romanomermis culicivorax TaxID=13658 RepID=A0A915HV35_ROMCU
MENDFKRTIHFILESINGADLIFKDALKTRISLVYAEVWSFGSKSFLDINEEIMQTLFNFIDYSSKQFYTISKDASLFITSANFSRHEISMAANGNICSGKSAGVVQFLNRFESFRLSVEIVHNLAHIVGVRHDQDVKPVDLIEAAACDCPERNGCLMTSRTISGKRNKFATEFSSCSISDFTNVLKSGRANCLFNKPMQESALALCGNKEVDVGEMCDCGSADECELVDPCCDPITCTLKKGAECGAGHCCDDCK